MRLNTTERRAVETACRECFPAGTRVLLFGSRADDTRRGGDIDLLVELPAALPVAEVVVARLYRLLDERRIDVVVNHATPDDDRPVVVTARRTGGVLAVA